MGDVIGATAQIGGAGHLEGEAQISTGLCRDRFRLGSVQIQVGDDVRDRADRGDLAVGERRAGEAEVAAVGGCALDEVRQGLDVAEDLLARARCLTDIGEGQRRRAEVLGDGDAVTRGIRRTGVRPVG